MQLLVVLLFFVGLILMCSDKGWGDISGLWGWALWGLAVIIMLASSNLGYSWR